MSFVYQDTAHKNRWWSETFIAEVLGAVNALVMVLDEQGNIIAFNDACEQLSGYSFKDVSGQQYLDKLIPPEQRQSLEFAIKGLITGRDDGKFEVTWTTQKGGPVQIHWTGNLVEAEGRRWIVATGSPRFEKPTQSHAASQEAVRQAVNEAQQLKNYATQIKRVNQDLQDFAFIASHDLQEPLRKIQAFGIRLQSRYRDQLGEEGADYLDRMVRAADGMQSMVSDLLEYSLIGRENIPSERVSLEEILADTMISLDYLVPSEGGRVETAHPLPDVMANEVHMRLLLFHLLSNGLKFCRPGVPPVVKLYQKQGKAWTPEAPLYVELVVEDNGIGFDQEDALRIFQPFQRLHGKVDYPGNGIGLAICRKVVERLGGTITVTSHKDVGSTFTFTLPAVS